MAAALIKNIGRTVVGKPDAVELVLVALLCQGHMLLEDVPGVGKTLLAKALARSLGCTFRRIQFTPDLLRSDVTGHHRLPPPQGRMPELDPDTVLRQVLIKGSQGPIPQCR